MTSKIKLSAAARGFTLVELMVVIAMIALIMAALVTSLNSARQRARVQKATSDVKILTQAILAYENYDENHELPALGGTSPQGGVDIDQSSVGFIFGKKAVESGKVPNLILSALSAGGRMYDPWGIPYKVQIKPATADVRIDAGVGTIQTGFWYPNHYRLTAEERK